MAPARRGSILDLLPPDGAGLEGPVVCDGDAVHGVRWDGSGLRSVGHEATDEAILAALGGTRPLCVELGVRWRERRLEPLLVAAMSSGDSGLLSRQTLPSVGPPLASPPPPPPPSTSSSSPSPPPFSLALSLPAGAGVGWARYPLPSAFYESVKPFLDLPSPLQRVLAADAALAFSASDVWQRGTRDNTVEVANVVRSMLRSAADVAFGVPVGPVAPRLLAVSGDVGGAPVLFLRGRRAPVELAGRLPVAWIALAVLGLAVVGDALVVELSVDGDVVRGRGFRLVGRDADLTSCDVTLSRRDAERRVALAVFS